MVLAVIVALLSGWLVLELSGGGAVMGTQVGSTGGGSEVLLPGVGPQEVGLRLTIDNPTVGLGIEVR